MLYQISSLFFLSTAFGENSFKDTGFREHMDFSTNSEPLVCYRFVKGFYRFLHFLLAYIIHATELLHGQTRKPKSGTMVIKTLAQSFI